MLCMEVAEGVAGHGHDVSVLTSTYGYDHEVTEAHVYRLLSLEAHLQFYAANDAWSYPQRRRRNLQHLRRLVASRTPDILFVWGMWNLSNSLAHEAERLMGARVVYYLANPWPIEANMHQAYWDAPATSFARQIAKRLVRIPARLILREEWRAVPLRFEHAPCCSAAQRNQLLAAGVPLKDAPVLYEGIELRHYLASAAGRTYERPEGRLSLVFVGILAEHKGVHTTIEALNHLSVEERTRVRLTIVGRGHEHYEERLRSLVRQHHLSECVAFRSPIARSELPEFLGQFEALLLPSIWAEPLARIMQEGLASGMVVIGSANGGTAETITHGENGLLFKAGDAIDLAKQLRYALSNPDICRVLAKKGVQTAKERFDIDTMVTQIEEYLAKVHATAP